MTKTLKQKNVQLVKASNKDIFNIYGCDVDIDHEAGDTCEAWIATITGEALGVGGYVTHLGHHTLFLNILHNGTYKRQVLKLLINHLKYLRNTGLRFLVIRDKNEINANSFLQKLGFRLSYHAQDNEIWCDYA